MKVIAKLNFLLFLVLATTNALASPCGLSGSIEARILDCSLEDDAQKEGFVLVARTADFKNVYQEISTDLLWTDIVPNPFNIPFMRVCAIISEEMTAGIAGHWVLPSKKNYEDAEASGIRKVSNMNEFLFWTSTTRTPHGGGSYIFHGAHGSFHRVLVGNTWAQVRCTQKASPHF